MEKPFSGVSATGREELEVIGVRAQNIEIFIKNIKFQDLTLLFHREKKKQAMIARFALSIGPTFT